MGPGQPPGAHLFSLYLGDTHRGPARGGREGWPPRRADSESGGCENETGTAALPTSSAPIRRGVSLLPFSLTA